MGLRKSKGGCIKGLYKVFFRRIFFKGSIRVLGGMGLYC